jgi:hypothetical protein
MFTGREKETLPPAPARTTDSYSLVPGVDAFRDEVTEVPVSLLNVLTNRENRKALPTASACTTGNYLFAWTPSGTRSLRSPCPKVGS